MERINHQGYAIKRLREILNIKQQTIADVLGITQQGVSLLESKQTIDKEQLEVVAKALGVKVETIEGFREDAIVHQVQNNYEGSNPNATLNTNISYCTLNYADKWLEAIEQVKELYEKLLQAEKEKADLLRQIKKADT